MRQRSFLIIFIPRTERVAVINKMSLLATLNDDKVMVLATTGVTLFGQREV